MKTVRILVVDDHEVIRAGVRLTLQKQRGWEICGEATDGLQAVQQTFRLQPDIVILDVTLPLVNGLSVAHQILCKNPRQQILILTDINSDQIMHDALRIGVRGFLLKSDPARDLVAAIVALQQGGAFFTATMAEMVLRGYVGGAREPELTHREREIAQLLAEGNSTKDVASILRLSVRTAATHRHNLMSKLKVHSLPELILYAIRNNIIFVTNSALSLQLAAESQRVRIREDLKMASLPVPNPLAEMVGTSIIAVATNTELTKATAG
jgi:DNA-binding NarL/FixJ family response regulator